VSRSGSNQIEGTGSNSTFQSLISKDKPYEGLMVSGRVIVQARVEQTEQEETACEPSPHPEDIGNQEVNVALN
jgi:hypothetical protein